LAKAVHDLGPRAKQPFVAINCGAIPENLLESELFGHERGAFTGALTQTIGRFQLADRGTLFLDEIGDLPLELQPKLLRALQEQEFERLGSARTIRVNVRIVAATNLDLAEMVKERRFRADLFYRLNVFPIQLPTLRERYEDIPDLVWHFIRMFGGRMNKEINAISEEAVEIIRSHSWPGNIRELQNFVERAVIMSPGPVLRPPTGDLKLLVQHSVLTVIPTLAQTQRDHILEVLKRVGGVVGGREGAAAQLGLPRTTLLYRMRKLGIRRARSKGGTLHDAALREGLRCRTLSDSEG
jgi:formate hydrogenlyase transcriptional activator